MQQHGSTYFACSPPTYPTLGMGSVGHNSTFSEHGHVAYQMKKKITKCSNMVANILPAMGSIGQNLSFSEHVHVKLNGITKCSNMVANILPADPPPDPRGHKGQIQIFQNNVMLHIK